MALFRGAVGYRAVRTRCDAVLSAGNAIARENLQVYGMWLSFALAAAVITFFAAHGRRAVVGKVAGGRREEVCAINGCSLLRAQAAGAAHELGTPPATMSVLLKKMQQDHPDRCRTI